MRYLPLTDADRREMLDTVGVAGIDDLFVAVPSNKLLRDLPEGLRYLLRQRQVPRLHRRQQRQVRRSTAARCALQRRCSQAVNTTTRRDRRA